MKRNKKITIVKANILLAHGSKDPRWRKPFETLLEKIDNNSPKKYSASVIWSYVVRV